jgi:hypothetical protein
MSVRFGRMGLALTTVLLMHTVSAHHSFGQFDDKKCMVIQGAVKKFEFSYPHTWLWVISKSVDGSDEIWGFEGADPATLALYGWGQDFLKKGDKITVAFNPLRDGRKGGSMRKITLPNGKIVSAQGDETVFAKCEPTATPPEAK